MLGTCLLRGPGPRTGALTPAARQLAVFAWPRTARVLRIVLSAGFALVDVRAVRPDAARLLADLLTHPSVLIGQISADASEAPS